MMRLGISNLAIPGDAGGRVLAALHALGVAGIEVAPTRLGTWDDLTKQRLVDYRLELSDHGLVISSLQALMFGTQRLQLLGDDRAFKAMMEHFRKVAWIGATLGASVGVFGAPLNRIKGEASAASAWSLGRDRLRALAGVVAASGFVLGLEPVPSAYGADFLTDADEVTRMVSEVNHNGLRVHLDTGCAFLGGGSISEAVRASGGYLAHFHIAEPHLKGFEAPVCDHFGASDSLSSIDYGGWVVIEMREQPTDPLGELYRAARFASAYYFNKS